MPLFRRLSARSAGVPAAPAPAPAAPVTPARGFGMSRRVSQPAPAPVATPAAQPNLSTAIGQLKSGDRLGADATMRSTVGLPAINRPAMPANPTLQDATERMKAGDAAGGREIMRKLVGLKKGGKVSATSASKRADGIVQRGKTRGRMV
jgi:hypothetical protein